MGPAEIRGTAIHSSPSERIIVQKEGIPGTLSPADPSFWYNRNGSRGERTLLLKIPAPRGKFNPKGPGEKAMTTDNNQTPENKTGTTMRPVWDGILAAARATPRRMPAGGWFREVATSENWRTTTIVQRHRDRAVMTPSS